MPKVNYSEFIRSFSGEISGLVYYEADGQRLVRHAATVKKPRTKRQKDSSGRFSSAGAYAKRVLADPALKAAYQALCRGHQNTRNVAIRDFLTPPVIEEMRLDAYTGRPRQQMWVKATDDFRVAQVQLVVRDPVGAVVEQGCAALDSATGDWCYTTGSELASGLTVSITAIATDQPGNTTECQRWHYLCPPSAPELRQ